MLGNLPDGLGDQVVAIRGTNLPLDSARHRFG